MILFITLYWYFIIDLGILTILLLKETLWRLLNNKTGHLVVTLHTGRGDAGRTPNKLESLNTR